MKYIHVLLRDKTLNLMTESLTNDLANLFIIVALFMSQRVEYTTPLQSIHVQIAWGP